MGTLEAELSDGNNLVLLKGASTIGITASAETERGKGLSTVRFVIAGDEAKGEEPFAALTVWHEKGNILDLSVNHEIKLEGCSLRECNWDPSSGKLYVTVYTQAPSTELRRIFSR